VHNYQWLIGANAGRGIYVGRRMARNTNEIWEVRIEK
jgi:hypothetical protein